MPEFLTMSEAADHLGVGLRTIRRYISDGLLPAYRVAGVRLIRVKAADLNALVTPIPSTRQAGGA